jgi:hypothetical protein
MMRLPLKLGSHLQSLILGGAFLASLPSYSGDVSAADAGARYGQAVAASKICPAGAVTAKATSLKSSFIDENSKIFEVEAAKVTSGWDQAFKCVDRDPNTGRTTSCRRMKLLNCRQAWLEIGPEGSAIPGLLDMNYDGWGKDE